MRSKSSTIDEFRGKGLQNKRSVFKLTKDQSGRYSIKRNKDTLLLYSEEQKALDGFKTLKEKRS